MKGRIVRPDANVSNLKFPIIGKLKIGEKNERGFPVSIDYFKPAGKYAGLFTHAYGDRPQSIQIVFPSDEPEQVCCEQYEYRNDSGDLIATGNGEQFKVWDGKKYIHMDTDNYPNLMQSIAIKYPTKEVQKQKIAFCKDCENANVCKSSNYKQVCNEYKNYPFGWRIKLTLSFIIPCVKGVAGIWRFETSGNASTIPAIRNTFDSMLNERGFVKGVIFDLNVQFAKTQKPGDNSRFPVVTLVANQSDENMAKIRESYKPFNSIENE